MMDNKKDAVNIGVTLSTQLISASLAMIAILGGLATYTIDKQEIPWYFYALITLSFFTFIISIYRGGKGIDKVRKEGFNGNWNLDDSKSYFNYQAGFCFLGLIFFSFSILSSILFSKEKSETQIIIAPKTGKNIYAIQFIDSLEVIEIEQLKKKIQKITLELEELKLTVEANTARIRVNEREKKK